MEGRASTICNAGRIRVARRFLACLCLLAPVPAQSFPGGRDSASVDPGADRWSVLTLIRYQSGLNPDMQARDVYKLLYQAALGVEHLLTDSAGARVHLMEELAGADSAAGSDPLVERISPDGRMVRINLRPFKALNLPAEALVQSMFGSAAETVADTALLYRWWNEYASLVRFGVLARPVDMAEWTRRMEQGEIDPVHHSEGYVKSNRPAYRVVRRESILPILNNLGIP